MAKLAEQESRWLVFTCRCAEPLGLGGNMKIAQLLLVPLVTLGAVATEHSRTPPWDQDYDYVVKVNAGNDGYLYISVKGNFSDQHHCSNPAFGRSSNPLTNEATKAEMNIAMASFVTRKKVHVWTDGCIPYGYPIITKIEVIQE